MVFQEIPFTDWNFLDEYKLRNCLLVAVVVSTVPCTFPYLLSCSLPGPEYHKGYYIALQSNKVEWRQVLIKFAFNVQIFKSSLSASCLLSHVPFRPTGWREFLISVLSTSLWRYGYLFSICWHFRFMSFPIIIWQIIIKNPWNGRMSGRGTFASPSATYCSMTDSISYNWNWLLIRSLYFDCCCRGEKEDLQLS